MSDPPRLRDLPEGGFARDLLRHAAPTPAMRPDDALRLAPAVAKIATSASLPAALLANYGIHALVALGLLSSLVLGARALRPRAKPSAPAAVRVVSAPAVAPVTPAPRRAEVIAAQAIPSVHRAPPAGPPLPRTLARVAPAVGVTPPAVETLTPAIPRVAPPAVEVPAPIPAPAVGGGLGAAPSTPRAPTLTEELTLLRNARAALRASPAEAVEVLREGAARFPGGQMRDDREALLIEALLRAGRRDEAASRLRALSATNASGAQVARLRAMLQNTP
jgi:hypothetical protein